MFFLMPNDEWVWYEDKYWKTPPEKLFYLTKNWPGNWTHTEEGWRRNVNGINIRIQIYPDSISPYPWYWCSTEEKTALGAITGEYKSKDPYLALLGALTYDLEAILRTRKNLLMRD